MADNYTQDLNQMEHLQINSSQDQRSFQPQENNIAMSTGKSHRNHFRNDQNRQSNKINNNNRPRQNRPFKNNSRQNDNQENNNQSYTNLSTNGYTSHNEQRENAHQTSYKNSRPQKYQRQNNGNFSRPQPSNQQYENFEQPYYSNNNQPIYYDDQFSFQPEDQSSNLRNRYNNNNKNNNNMASNSYEQRNVDSGRGRNQNSNKPNNRKNNKGPLRSNHSRSENHNDQNDQDLNQNSNLEMDRTNTLNLNKDRGNLRTTQSNKPSSSKRQQSNKLTSTQNLSRSEILTEQIRKNKCECMICCQNIRNDKSIWSCDCCFQIFHFQCIKKWAQSPSAKIEETSDKWRCPGCQKTHNKIPPKSTCFCGKKNNPEGDSYEEKKPYHLRQLAHSCGEICNKPLTSSSNFYKQEPETSVNVNTECKHKCFVSCHPGPCQPCDALVNRSCNCGKSKFQVKCSSNRIPECDRKCDNYLNCKLHICERICHSGQCKSCEIDIEQTCYSHKTERTVKCGSDDLSFKHEESDKNHFYNCNEICDKLLSCGNHKCQNICHDGPCPPCLLLPSKLAKCPCGKTQMKELLLKKKIIRTSCLDLIPTCENKCDKILHIHNDDVHTCEAQCHSDECPKCEKKIKVKCRCGKETETIECHEREEVKFCNRRCSRKKSCGRHQCNELCCNDKDHLCVLICNRVLNCGIHKCDQLCHKSGQCPRCLEASFEERICECGFTIEYPPIRCGTKPIECTKPCSRVHSCEHPVTHNCHWDEKCPPCSFLTSKMCSGNHEIRHNIPCYMENVSCGRPCDKPLANCSHKCNKTCHKGECFEEGSKCVQLCKKERQSCLHPCNEICHGDEPCPDTVCQETIVAKCNCGIKTKQVKCMQRMHEMNHDLACELKEMLSCRSIDISSFKNTHNIKKKTVELVCDEECFLAERNRSMAAALQLDPNSKPKAIYSDFLKSYAREEPGFVFDLEKRFDILKNEDLIELTKVTLKRPVRYTANGLLLVGLIKELKLSKLNKKTHNFPVMKSFERKFIHELAGYYGFETLSHDSEPNRNLAVYAIKEKCFIPSPTLMQSIEVKPKLSTMSRISNIKQLSSTSNRSYQSLGSTNQVAARSDFLPLQSSNTFSVLAEDDTTIPKTEKSSIDYFDMI